MGNRRKTVSRRHAIISESQLSWSIRDLGSSNGTFLNGERLTKDVEYTISDGDIVSLGRAVKISIEIDSDLTILEDTISADRVPSKDESEITEMIDDMGGGGFTPLFSRNKQEAFMGGKDY